MSTQIFGEYDIVMDILKKEIKKSFEKELTQIMVMKIVNEKLVWMVNEWMVNNYLSNG